MPRRRLKTVYASTNAPQSILSLPAGSPVKVRNVCGSFDGKTFFPLADELKPGERIEVYCKAMMWDEAYP